MKILFTICGRAGSKGLKNKNLKMLDGIPLVYYTISAIDLFIKKNPSFKVVTAINTDSKELADIAINNPFDVDVIKVERKDCLAGDVVGKVDVVKDTFINLGGQGSFDVVVDVDITSPLRTVENIEYGINELIKHPEYDLLYSVVSARRNPYFNMVQETSGGFFKKVCESSYTARQQAPAIYELNASIYVYNPRFLISDIKGTIFDYKCGIIPMRDYLVLDIDSEEDFVLLEKVMYIFSEDEGLSQVLDRARM